MVIRAVLIDLSGTLHIDSQAIPGCVEALKRLMTRDLRVRFVTNTTKESKRTLHERLTGLGFDIRRDDIVSSLTAARRAIEARGLRPMLLVAPEALEDFEGIPRGGDAVVVGLAPTEFHYERLNEAFRCLQAGAKLIAIHSGKYYKRKDGLALGPGCFVKGLEYSAQCTAELVGKPNKSFFASALGDVPPGDAVMIGDDVTDDVKGAMDAGLMGYLVKTGKYQPGDEDHITPPPSGVFPSFVEAIDDILSKL